MEISFKRLLEISNGSEEKQIYKDQLDEFLSSGWERGIYKRKALFINSLGKKLFIINPLQ